MDAMQILSRLYDLLSQSSEKDLRDAARLAGDDSDLADAIIILAGFKRVSGKAQQSSLGSGSNQPRKHRRSTRPTSQRSMFPPNGADKKLADVILSKKFFKTNKELGKYLSHVNVPFRVDVKDSRKRIYNKIVNWLEQLPSDRQRIAYMELLQVLPPSETAGWFDAIRSSRS